MGWKWRRARPPRRGSGVPSREPDQPLGFEAAEREVHGGSQDLAARVLSELVDNRPAGAVGAKAADGEQHQVLELAEGLV